MSLTPSAEPVARDRARRGATVRLDRNEAPFGPPPGALRRIRAAGEEVHRYPDEQAREVTAALAAHFGVEPARVIVTAGVDEASDLCILELGDPLTITPGFPGFADRAAALGRRCEACELDDDFTLPTRLLAAAGAGRLVMLASPNNPTGNAFAPAALGALLATGAHVVLDETYGCFAASAPGIEWLAAHERLLVFRSFSKAYALAGLRVGCLIGAPDVIARLRRRQAYCTVGGLACAALIGALSDDDGFHARVVAAVVRERVRLIGALRALALFAVVHDSDANFVLATCAGAERAAAIRDALLRDGDVAVASTASLGLPAGLRITVGTPEENAHVVAVLGQIEEEMR